jgi:NtrC-family two-component system response regulator AlgB
MRRLIFPQAAADYPEAGGLWVRFLLSAMKLLLIGDERKNRRMVAWGFASEPYRVQMATARSQVTDALEHETFHAACIDWKMQEENAALLVELLRERIPELPVIALIGEKDRHLTGSLREMGVAAYLVSPFPIENLHAMIRVHARVDPVGLPKRAREERPASSGRSAPPFGQLMTNDEIARRTLELAVRAANSSAAILILGETGTGKTLLAQTVHQHSRLRAKPFVTVNCPCLNHELLESDLFGHVRGSFTGAVQDTWGKVAAAEGGTLFLDEIGDLPMALQPKLLRLLQEKQYERVGETTSRSANVRIIAATNRDLKREVAAGRFREDLYYRLNVIAIDVPPLRNRPMQIMGAAEAFLAVVCDQLGKSPPSFTPEARQLIEGFAWPGNLRELRNVVERAAILSTGDILEAADFPALLADAPAPRYEVGAPISLRALENAHIQMVVANSTSLEEAARILEIDKSTLYRKRKQMEARVEQFEDPVGASAPVALASGI